MLVIIQFSFYLLHLKLQRQGHSLGLKTITIGIQKEPKLELQHFKHFRLERGLRY